MFSTTKKACKKRIIKAHKTLFKDCLFTIHTLLIAHGAYNTSFGV